MIFQYFAMSVDHHRHIVVKSLEQDERKALETGRGREPGAAAEPLHRARNHRQAGLSGRAAGQARACPSRGAAGSVQLGQGAPHRRAFAPEFVLKRLDKLFPAYKRITQPIGPPVQSKVGLFVVFAQKRGQNRGKNQEKVSKNFILVETPAPSYNKNRKTGPMPAVRCTATGRGSENES